MSAPDAVSATAPDAPPPVAEVRYVLTTLPEAVRVLRAGAILGAVALLSLSTGCESDADKLTRLKQEYAVAHLTAWYQQRVMDSLSGSMAQLDLAVPSHRLRADTLRRALNDAQRSLSAAQLDQGHADSQIQRMIGR